MKLYGKTEALRLTGCNYRVLDHWTRRGWVHAENDNEGSGVPRVWCDAELIIARRMRALIDLGIGPAAASAHARHGKWVQLTDGTESLTLNCTSSRVNLR